MSISLALSSAISALQVNQAALATTANNIANANTEGYSRKIVDVSSRLIEGIGAGVEISNITRRVDEFLIRDMRVQLSNLGLSEVLEKFYASTQDMFGPPDSNTSIAATLSELATALQSLTVTPESSNEQFTTIEAAKEVARQLNEMEQTIQDLRREADLAIDLAVAEIDKQLKSIADLNSQISRNKALGRPTADLEDARDRSIAIVAENMDIGTFSRDNGKIVLFGASGRTLVDISASTIAYTPVSSLSAAIQYPNTGIGGITVNGNDITTELKSGKLKALIDMRDSILPNLTAQIDELAAVLRDQLNAIHNDGTTFPPPNTLTGTRVFDDSLTDTVTLTGIVRFSVVDTSGKSVGVPMDLDLDALAVAIGADPTVNQIRDAINGDYSGSGIPGLTGATASVNTAGNLVITADNADNGIAINERTSSEAGTGFGFSHYFGLNDLFVGDPTISLAGSIKVRADIIANPGLLSRGELSEGTLTDGTRAISVGNNTIAKRMSDLFTQDLTFAATGGLPKTTTDLSGYGATILATNANLAAQTKDVLEFRKILFMDTKSKAESFSGVNVDEEMSNMILFQNAYNASARIISALDEMLRTLIDMVR